MEGLEGIPGVVHIVDVFIEKGSYYILMTDYHEGYTDLFDYNAMTQKLSGEDIKAIIVQIVAIARALLDAGVDHRDIKDENILYHPTTKDIKLIDFGSASRVEKGHVYTALQGERSSTNIS